MVTLDPPKGEITLNEAIERFDISPIVRVFSAWAVTSYGLECLTTYYPIEKRRLDEDDWLEHMRGKVWVAMGHFQEALQFARKYHLKHK